jgi:hypothetical protein
MKREPQAPRFLFKSLFCAYLSFLLTLSEALRITFFDPNFVGQPYTATWHRNVSDPTQFYLQSHIVDHDHVILPSDTLLVQSNGAQQGIVTFTQCNDARVCPNVFGMWSNVFLL